MPVNLEPQQLGVVEDEDGHIKINDEEISIPPAAPPALTTESPESRLMIDYIRVVNFKSYAGSQIIGPLNKNFTAVVGPNGSGKSNVIDSLLFVLGYRARKIRSKKVSHLIHKSDRYPNCDSCTVEVNFVYVRDEYEVESEKFVPDSRFSLSRTATKDESSVYKLSGKTVTYKEVIKALKAYGIDVVHSRFLILQGEIEAISLMPPKAQNDQENGMMEYIEDIIGTNRFIEPIKHFKEIVEKLNLERKLMLANLKMVEKEKDELEAPKNIAIQFLRLENKQCLIENSLCHLKRHETEESLEEIIGNKKEFIDEMNALKKEIENVRNSKKAFESSITKLNSEIEIHHKKHEEMKSEFAKLEHQDTADREQIKLTREKIQKLESTLESDKKDLSKLQKQASVYEQETAELGKKKTKLEEEKAVDAKNMEEVMGSLKKETNNLQEKKDKLEAELVQLKNKSYQIKSEMDLAASELKILKSGEKKEKEKFDSLVTSHEKAIQSLKNEETLFASETDKLKSDHISDYMQQLDDAKEAEEKLTFKFKDACMKLEDARTSLSTSSSRSTIVQAFLKEKSKGRLCGVYGRLGDLGAIDEKYDVAISTACGALDNIVTDTMETAQECVQFLKKNNLGYTTFIALDKMKVHEQRANSKISTPEDSVRLFDMIRVTDRNLLPAFYFALRDTLVAKDLEQATRIGLQGRQRYRVVTLKGELIETSGTMSGGGGRVMRGRMGQTVRQCSVTSEDVSKLSRNAEALRQELDEVKKERLHLEEQIAQKDVVTSSLQRSLKKRTMNINAYKESVKELSSQLENQKRKLGETKMDEKRVKMLEDEIKEKNKKYTKASEEESVVEQQVAKLQAEILQISKGKFSKVKQNFNLLEKKLKDVTSALTKSNVNFKSNERKIKKALEKIKDAESCIVENKAKLDKLKEKQSVLTKEGEKIHQLIEESAEKINTLEAKKKELKKEGESYSEKEQKLKVVEIEHKNKLKTFEASETEQRGIIKSINSKMSKLKLNEVEDDTIELPSYSKEEIEKMSEKNLRSDLDTVRVQLEDIKPDMSAIAEFKKKLQLFEEKQKEVDDMTAKRDLQQKRFEYLSTKRVSEFLAGFKVISTKLQEIYRMLTYGGNAELEILDQMQPFEKGIEYSVRPPKKSWKYMRNLSGGEKTLSSLSLVFALHYYRPTPFYVMDEIDAALDVRNVAIVGYYLKETTKNTQFLIVSLRNVMNELSDHLLGIYKIDNCTRNINISNVHRWSREMKMNGKTVDVKK